jgi:hypothetical protein
MTKFELPEGFKLIPKRNRSHDVPDEIKNQQYAVSEKGELFDLDTGLTHVPLDGESTVTIVKEGSGWRTEREFDIPILVGRYFEGREEVLNQKDLDELATLSGLSADECREKLDAGWAYEITEGEDGNWFKAED